MDEIKFLEKKKYSYLRMLLREDSIEKLNASSLLIGIVHDLCKKNNKIFVNEKFIDLCASKLIILGGENLDNLEKFDIIRNKLAHGDYYIEGTTVIFNYHDNQYRVSIESIISFANEMANYYQYMNSNTECNNLQITDGVVFKISDICMFGKRNSQYRRILQKGRMIKFYEKPNIGKKFKVSNKYCEITYEVLSYTDEEDKYVENYWGNSLIYILYDFLFKNKKNELVDGFIDFYINYIYGLDNLLKSNDKSIFAFGSNKMFDFSMIDVGKSDTEKNDIVGPVKQYDINLLYENISKLLKKINRVNIDKLEQEELNSEIDRIVEILKNKSIQRMYSYSNIRSEIEHIRCAIMHGNCIKKNGEDFLCFFDEYNGNIVFKKEVSTEEFIEFACNKKNNSIIEKHISRI